MDSTGEVLVVGAGSVGLTTACQLARLGVHDLKLFLDAEGELTVEQTLGAIEECRRAGFRSVNVDLIYGLPRQNPAGFGRTLAANALANLVRNIWSHSVIM